ncbi:MAG: glycoside hydrolase family 2 TIM barrel-domain containing protein [Dehalococcoidia bacterium]|nr:glycoside hydrolase family 2 TIM barrel-domain containing protein [Dehalococcoidia bacterium]
MGDLQLHFRDFVQWGANLMKVSAGLPARMRTWPLPLAGVVCLCLFLIPALPLIHQSVVLGIAILLRGAASSLLVKQLLLQVGMDPVYASVFNRTVGNIEAKGLAVAGPLGDTLHQWAPGFFATSDKVMPGAWATALVGDGVSVLASALAMAGTGAIFMAGGLALLWAALRRRRVSGRISFYALAFLSIMLQARGLVGLTRRVFSAQEIEIMGFSQFFTKLSPMDAISYRQLASGPLGAVAPYVVPSLVVLAVYGGASTILLVRRARQRKRASGIAEPAKRSLRLPSLFLRTPLRFQNLAGIVLLLSAVTSPVFLPARADYDYGIEAEAPDPELMEQPPGEAAPIPEPPVVKGVAAEPSKVVISGSNYSYSYSVDGRPVRIKGVGYNALYSSLSRADRAARYDWDFSEMRAVGVNTILGWGLQNFDELTLDKAQEYGLGVVMPYRLATDGDYADPGYQQVVEQSVKDWVQRYRGYPALRIWGIGNEVIHAINPFTPRAKAFAKFYIRLVDEVHSLDPDHPVIYRDAEDINLAPIKEVLEKDKISRPWFVYGGNFFTYRICEALPDWPKKGMDLPILVSEFAPSGLSPEDRPKGYLHMLQCISKAYPTVLGAFPYVWTTEGPEAIDRTMGLVGADGQPVDRSLWAIGKAFRREGVRP